MALNFFLSLTHGMLMLLCMAKAVSGHSSLLSGGRKQEAGSRHGPKCLHFIFFSNPYTEYLSLPQETLGVLIPASRHQSNKDESKSEWHHRPFWVSLWDRTLANSLAMHWES